MSPRLLTDDEWAVICEALEYLHVNAPARRKETVPVLRALGLWQDRDLMPQRRFDRSAFFAAIDEVRSVRGLQWKQVAAESGVNASTLTRLGAGKHLSVDSFAALVAWGHLDANAFLCAQRRTGWRAS